MIKVNVFLLQDKFAHVNFSYYPDPSFNKFMMRTYYRLVKCMRTYVHTYVHAYVRIINCIKFGARIVWNVTLIRLYRVTLILYIDADRKWGGRWEYIQRMCWLYEKVFVTEFVVYFILGLDNLFCWLEFGGKTYLSPGDTNYHIIILNVNVQRIVYKKAYRYHCNNYSIRKLQKIWNYNIFVKRKILNFNEMGWEKNLNRCFNENNWCVFYNTICTENYFT